MRLINIDDERLWDILFDEAYVEGGQAKRIKDELEKIVVEEPENKWIPVSERLPEEHESMFAKFEGTPKWLNEMFEKISDNVNVTIKFENGKTVTTTSHTTDGKWRCEKEYGLNTKVIAWMPLPEPYSTDMREKVTE